jgi:putative membrane protein
MMYYGPVASGWGYLLVTMNMVLFWGLIIAGIVALVRLLNRSTPPHPADPGSPGQAEAILAERFGRGEIDEEEYQRRLAVLRSGAGRTA